MKIKSLLLSGLLLSGFANAQSHKFEWANSTGSSNAEYTNAVVTDKDGNIYTSGRFRNTMDFDPGPGTTSLTAVSTAFDFYVSKFNKNGNFEWVKQLGGTAYKSNAAYLGVDTAGNIYVTGDFFGTMDFDPGAGTYELSADSSADMFVAKYDRDGSLLWAKQIGGFYSSCTPAAISTDSFGNVYTTGVFNDTVDFDPGPGTFALHSVGYQDFYVSKLDQNGAFVWAKTWGNTDANGMSFAIAIDHMGNSYTAGNFTGTIDFDPGAGVSSFTAVASQSFVVKLDPAGDFAWAKQLENSSSESGSFNTARSLALDKSGDLYLAGNLMGTADFNPGTPARFMTADSLDAYVLKLSKDGDYAWAKQFGGPSQDQVTCIRTDTADNIYMAGMYYEGGDFDPGVGKYMLKAVGKADIFIVKLDQAGTLVWAKSMGGSETDNITMIACDQEMSLYAAGNFAGSADFNPGSAVYTLSSAGSYDLFLQKMSICTPTIAPDTVITSFCKSYTFEGITYTMPGIYTQAISNSDGCDSIITFKFTTEPTVDMTVTKTGNTLEAAAVATAYQWVECPSNDFVMGATNKSFTPSKNGSYAVIVYVDPCRYTSACVSVTGLGIEENEEAQPVVYPSPTKGLLTIATKESLKNATLHVLNLNGQLVLSKENLSGRNFELDLSALVSGMYFLKITNEDKVMGMTKIIKE